MRVGAHGVTRPTLPFAKPSDFDSRAAQDCERLAAMLRIGVRRADNDPFYSRRLDGVGARRRATLCRTRFQSDVKCRACRAVATTPGIANRFDQRLDGHKPSNRNE